MAAPAMAVVEVLYGTFPSAGKKRCWWKEQPQQDAEQTLGSKEVLLGRMSFLGGGGEGEGREGQNWVMGGKAQDEGTMVAEAATGSYPSS